jgi:hypothetical protein
VARIIAAQHSPQETRILADVLEPAEQAGWDRDQIARPHEHLAIGAALAGHEAPVP